MTARSMMPQDPSEWYAAWTDSAFRANERAGRLLRLWLNDSLTGQQEAADGLRRSMEAARATFVSGRADASPLALFSRAAEASRTTVALWTEVALKQQTRLARFSQQAVAEFNALPAGQSGR